MSSHRKLSRRGLVKLGLMGAGVPVVSKILNAPALGQDLGPGNRHVGDVSGRDEAALFPGPDLPGGGQTEIRLNQSIYTSDPDELEVAQRLRPFDPESWYQEWHRVAERNEAIAEDYAVAGLNVSANQFYLRAFRFHRVKIVYQPDSDPRVLPGYLKMRETFDRAWEMVQPPFERVTLTVDGNELGGYFRKPNGPEGTRFPTVICCQGADSMAENTILANAGYVARGLAYLVVDLPGHGAAKRVLGLYLPPDTERHISDVVDYLETRSDVDADRIGIQTVSMGGYVGPRAASGEPRIKAVWTSMGSHDLLRDLFDYYPPIQDRVRWIIGAENLVDARRKLADYTVEHVAHKIECPMLIGYSPTDRIMDPQGAFRLYQAAVNSEREMWAGAGHPHHDEKSGGQQMLRLPTAQDWAAKQLGVIA